jgi:probable rRNA maturation factor
MIVNRQRKVRVTRRPLEEFLRRIQKELKLANAEITIALVSDAEIARLNEAFRGKKGPTDVLSFPAGRTKKRDKLGAPGATGNHKEESLGDIAIAPDTARQYAQESKRTLQNELRVLMLHGVLHLLGYDHESDQGQMNRIERRLRRRLGLA